MTGGTAAGVILSDLIVEGSNQWTDVFDPMRFTPSSGIPFLEKNATVAARWFGDRAKQWVPFEAEPRMPDRGEGAVIRRGGRPVAVYRDERGELHASSRPSVRTCGVSSTGTTRSGRGIARVTDRGSTAMERSSTVPQRAIYRPGSCEIAVASWVRDG